MKAILFGAFALLSTLAVAQPQAGTFSVTPKVGVNLNKWSGNLSDGLAVGVFDMDAYNNYLEEHKDDKTQGQVPQSVYYNSMQQEFRKAVWKTGFSCGIDFQHQVTDQWAIVYGLNYSYKRSGYKDTPDVTVYLRDPQFEFKTNSFGYKMHYFQVPLMLKHYVCPGLAVGIGVQVGFLRQAYRKYDGQFKFNASGNYIVRDDEYGSVYLANKYERGSWNDYKSDFRISENFNRVEIALPVGISYEYGHLVTDLRCESSLKNLLDSDDVKARNNTIVLSVGYRFDL